MRAAPVSEAEKPKAFIHWVADPLEIEVSSKHKKLNEGIVLIFSLANFFKSFFSEPLSSKNCIYNIFFLHDLLLVPMASTLNF